MLALGQTQILIYAIRRRRTYRQRKKLASKTRMHSTVRHVTDVVKGVHLISFSGLIKILLNHANSYDRRFIIVSIVSHRNTKLMH